MNIEHTTILTHDLYAGEYRVLTLNAPATARKAVPGQFVHIRVPNLDAAVLRRPFSIFNVEKDVLSILYKRVGKGTASMAGLRAGEKIDLVGPLGKGFTTELAPGTVPLLVAGGYGVAPLYFLARRLSVKGVIFVGGATAGDVLCVQEFKNLGWDVRISTNDGSLGEKGFVTGILDAWLKDNGQKAQPELFACGPDGMLKALSERAAGVAWKVWISLDKHMGCGVGACLACVHKVRKGDGSSQWARVCREGPVFDAKDIIWDENPKK